MRRAALIVVLAFALMFALGFGLSSLGQHHRARHHATPLPGRAHG